MHSAVVNQTTSKHLLLLAIAMASIKSHTAANQSLELDQPPDASKLEAELKSLSQPEYPSTKRVAIIMFSVYIHVLDRSRKF